LVIEFSIVPAEFFVQKIIANSELSLLLKFNLI
jgi:hypothetical protein